MPSDGAEQIPEWCEDVLERLDMVMWDRFTVSDDPSAGRFYTVYGWIDRQEDEYKDFVVVRFFPETQNDLVSFTTSSDQWTHEIHERIFGESTGHNDCKRVESHFDVPNAIELNEQQKLVTDGGAVESGTERPEPYLWLAYHDNLDDPMWFLPLESEEDSVVWDDDELEIHIVSWSLHTGGEQ